MLTLKKFPVQSQPALLTYGFPPMSSTPPTF